MNKDDVPAKATSEELTKAGVHISKRCDPDTRKQDLLERYRAVPNHAMFLFTSEDSALDGYIRNHWSALDGLSGDICDIHVSLTQLLGDEDAYSQFDDIRSIPGLDLFDPAELPALHIWSKAASLRIRLSLFEEESALRDVLRLVFSELRTYGAPMLPENADDLSQKVQSLSSTIVGTSQSVKNAQVGRDLVQVTHIHHGSESSMSNNTSGTGKSKQTVESVRLTGEISQASDVGDAEQTIKDATGTDLNQTVHEEKQKLTLGKYSASGKWAVIGLVVIVVIVVVFKWLVK
jgi:hypothetical protein